MIDFGQVSHNNAFFPNFMLVSGFELLFELSAPLLYSESDDWGADSQTWFTSRTA